MIRRKFLEKKIDAQIPETSSQSCIALLTLGACRNVLETSSERSKLQDFDTTVLETFDSSVV